MNRERGRADALRANIWKLNLIQACRWFLLLMPVLVLFYQENGLSLHDVFRVQAFYSVCVIVFEVPSGYLADRLGRRRSMLAGVLCAAAGFWVYAFSTALPHFLAAQFCIALGASLISGSDAALLYDTLIELDRQDEYQKRAGRLGSIGNFSEGVAGLVGGLLALVSLRTPLYGQALVVLAAVPLVWSLVEPGRHRAVQAPPSMLGVVRYALHGDAEVKWLILYSSLVGTSTLTVVWLVQPYLKEAGLALAYFGAAWALLQFSVGFFSYHAHRIEGWLGRRAALVALIPLSGAAYLALGHFQSLWAAVFLLVFYLVRGVNGPVLGDYINRQVDSQVRATVLSVKSLVGRLMFAGLGPAVGWASDAYSLATAFSGCGVFFLLCGVFFLWRLRRNGVL